MAQASDPVRVAVAVVAGGAKALAQGALTALLPSPERERFARPREIDAPRWSFELGLVQLGVGVAMFLVGGLAFMRPAAADQSMTLLENWFPDLSTVHFQGLGLINWFAWFVFPGSWPLAYLAVVGLGRCIAFAVSREAVGEPVVWAGIRTWQRLRGRASVRARESRLGPMRPDRLLPGKGGELFVLSCRDKPDWTAAATIEIADRFYRLLSSEDRRDGRWNVVVYRLREQEPEAVIRGLVHYRPPAGTRAPRDPEL